uniref:Uncharacterized protein n=1 Tax=Leptobrachium leishanense TaxID=445787 RepID=A0A8C5WH60_9ANUR
LSAPARAFALRSSDPSLNQSLFKYNFSFVGGVIVRSTGVTTHHAADEKLDYQDILTNSILRTTAEETLFSTALSFNDSGIQTVNTGNDYPVEGCSLQKHSPALSPDSNIRTSDITENGWDNMDSQQSKQNSIKNTKATDSDLKEETVFEADHDSPVQLPEQEDSRMQSPILESEEDDKCLSIITEESVDLEKTKGNLNLLEQAITLQAEHGHMFHSTYKELDMFLLEHLARERRQTKVTDIIGKHMYRSKSKKCSLINHLFYNFLNIFFYK